jgi:hypothetical protein
MSLRDRRWLHTEEPTKLWGRLNEAWRELRGRLDNEPRTTLVDKTFTGPLASYSFKLASEPAGILLARLTNTTTNATSAVTWSWTWKDGVVTTNAFAALPTGAYRAAFMIIGGA